MKSLACLGIPLFFTGLALSATPPARAPVEIDSLALVRLLHLDEMLSRIVNEDGQQALAAGRITKSQFACLRTTPAEFTEGLATVARAELTPGELSSTLAYLRSENGRKFEAMIDASNANPATQSDFSSAEAEAFASFRASSAGKKLFATSMLMKTDGMNDVAGERAKRLKAKCQLTQPLQPPDGSPSKPETAHPNPAH